MDINKCQLCYNNNNNIQHDNCKYNYFDILKNLFKNEISDIQTQLNNKINECKQLEEINEKLVDEIKQLKLNIKHLEDDQLLERKVLELAPDTPPTQNTSLNRAMLVDTCNDESYKENFSDNKQNVDEFSSPDDKKRMFLDIPRRKKIPFRITTPNSKIIDQETKWISKKPLNKSNIGFSFIQPMHKTNTADINESPAKSKASLSKISLNKKLKQTRINFNKTKDNLDNSISKRSASNDETYCDDVIMPTPHNIITRPVRSNTSSTSTNTSPENKIFDFQLTPKEETNKKHKLSEEEQTTNIKMLNDSVEFLPVDEEIIFISDNTYVNNFESDDSANSCDLLEKYSMEFGKDEIQAETKLQPTKPIAPSSKNPPNKYNEYQITSPIRKKSEKAKRPGFDCPDCEKYYQLIGISMNDTEIQHRMNKCSKHRKNQRLHHTPEGFWNPVFTPTQD